MATVIGISTDELKENVAYASNELMNMSELDNNRSGVSTGNTIEKFKAEFAYEMEKITEKVISFPAINAENFKVEFSYAMAQVTAKVMPIIPTDQRTDFAYKMAKITTRINSDQNLDIEKAKAEFAYEIAQLTTKIITNADISTTANRSLLKVSVNDNDSKTALLRNNADIEKKVPIKVNDTITDQRDIDNKTYTGLIDELMHVGDRGNHVDNKVKVDGEVRYHYAFNRGSNQWDKDSSGIRTYLGFGTNINEDWRVNGMMDIEKSFVNYNNKFELSRLNVVGKLSSSILTAGSFGYLMAEGNIYDSGFKGAKADFGKPVKYTLSYGKTDYTKKLSIATARYDDFDYNLEVGIYHYQLDNGVYNQNTIRTLGGNYNFSNFGIGAMYLGSSLKDSKGESNGYVFSLNYGDLKTYRPGTYNIFIKYYNQPLGTYIEHGMNGIGNLGLMQGFKGYGIGTHYTFANNLVGGLEYYNLTDKVSGERGKTWWSELTQYF